MTHLPFLSGAVAGVAMSSLFWFGVSVFWEALGTRAQADADAPPRLLRCALGFLLVALALLPIYFICRAESWPVLRGYAAGAAAAAVLLFIELLRASKSQGA